MQVVIVMCGILQIGYGQIAVRPLSSVSTVSLLWALKHIMMSCYKQEGPSLQ